MSRTVDDRARDVRRWLEVARAVHADRARIAASIAASTGLSIEGVELGFESLERDATPAELDALVDSAGSARHVHVILSANVFVAPLRAIAIARAAAERVTVRPSSRDPALAVALVKAAGDPAVSIAEERDVALVAADRIDVYGRDETIARVRAAARSGVVVRGHGAGLGVAIVAGGEREMREMAEAARDVAADVVPFDQRGCLSPRVVFALGTPAQGEAFALALHRGLDSLASRVPRGALTPAERGESVRWRETLAFAGRVWAGADHVVALAAPQAALAVPPAGRHVLVVPVASEAEVRALLAPIARFVVSVGRSPLVDVGRSPLVDVGRSPLVDVRKSAGGDPGCAVAPPHARVALLGRMQHPPLDGPVDRRSV